MELVRGNVAVVTGAASGIGFALAERFDHAKRAIAEGVTPASIADAVADAVTGDRFWIIPQQEFLDLIVQRWETIAERLDPDPPEDVPGLPPRSQIVEEVLRVLAP